MDKTLTKIKALQICTELWHWLMKHPRIGTTIAKTSWPGWEIYGKSTNDCPCCEYVLQRTGAFEIGAGGRYCDKCPMKSLWGDDCVSDDSPYTKWWDSGRTNREKYARIIYLAAKKAYERELKK